ncbi:MAG TPA: hypothetical protein VH637_08515 [Streptosporangiaceae bacterium]
MIRLLTRRNRAQVSQAALSPSRYHGSLDAITDSERRALRPIGLSAYEVAVRTGALLAVLAAVPGVRIFQGVRAADGDLPRIAHAVSAGRRLLLVESVAWPPGRYAAAANGRIYCDGAYTGQSVRPLLAAVRYWRATLPPRHQVRALIVVHLITEGALALPSAGPDLGWIRADDAASGLRVFLPRRRQAISSGAVAVLVAATEAGAGVSRGGPRGDFRYGEEEIR